MTALFGMLFTSEIVSICYCNSMKTSAIYVAEDNYRSVYVGVNLGMISASVVRHQLIQVYYNWFYGLISSLEYDLVLRGV